jgi:hypothetical protein
MIGSVHGTALDGRERIDRSAWQGFYSRGFPGHCDVLAGSIGLADLRLGKHGGEKCRGEDA